MLTRFDRYIDATPTGDGTWNINIAPDWHVTVGPNGGYIAAILLRALRCELDFPQTRTITTHFLSASTAGPAELFTHIEKKGRTLTTATARLVQNNRTVAMAMATFGSARESELQFIDIVRPVVEDASDIPVVKRMNPAMDSHSPFRDQYDQRLAIGPLAPTFSDKARVGGWTRFRENRLFDDEAILAISDSWFPSIRARKTGETVHAPTVDHTVHFMTSLPMEDAMIDDFVLVEFATDVAQQGYLIENGSIWSKSGLLLAQSRQLAVILPR